MKIRFFNHVEIRSATAGVVSYNVYCVEHEDHLGIKVHIKLSGDGHSEIIGPCDKTCQEVEEQFRSGGAFSKVVSFLNAYKAAGTTS